MSTSSKNLSKIAITHSSKLVPMLWDPCPTLCTGTHSKLITGIVQLHSLELWKNNQEPCQQKRPVQQEHKEKIST